MRRIYILVIFSLLAIFSPAMAQDAHREDSVARVRAFEYYYMQAISLRELNELSSAVDLFLHCIDLQPDNASVLFELAPLYHTLRDKEKAIATMEKVVRKEPDNVWYRQVLANYYLDDNNIERAIEVYEELVKDDTSNGELYLYLASLYEENNNLEKAVNALNELERIEGKNEMLSMQRYRLYLMMQDKERSLTELRSMLNDSPDNLDLYVTMGDTYLRFGEKDSALVLYKNVLSQSPENLTAQYSICQYYRIEKNDSLYTSSMEQLLSNNKFDAEMRLQTLVEFIYYKEQTDTTGYAYRLFDKLSRQSHGLKDVLGLYVDYMYEKKDDKERILPVLNKLLSIEPENSRAQFYLILFAIQDQNYESVVTNCDKAIMYHPENLVFYLYKGLSCYELERKVEALEAYKQGLERRSDNTAPEIVGDVFAAMAELYKEFGKNELSYEAYDSALVYKSDDIIILNNYAYNLALDGKELERAEEMSLRTIKSEPENITYLDTYAWVLFCMERYDEAKAYANKIIDSGTELDVTLCNHIGDILANAGEIERAVEFWKKAQELGDNSKILQRKIKKRKYIRNEKRNR